MSVRAQQKTGANLLGTGIGICEKRVNARNACELDAWLVGLDVAAAYEAQVLPALSDRGKVRLGNALGDAQSGCDAALLPLLACRRASGTPRRKRQALIRTLILMPIKTLILLFRGGFTLAEETAGRASVGDPGRSVSLCVASDASPWS